MEVGRILPTEAAVILNVSPQFIRIAMQQGKLPIGTAVQMSSIWTYHISEKLLADYSGKDIQAELERIRGKRGAKDGQQSADFISCVAFGRDGEFAEKYLKQGTKVVVTGRIQTGSYTNRDGQKVYTTDVIVEEQEFAESKKAAGQQDGNNGGYSDAGDGFMNIPDGIDEELPFN